MTDNTDDRPSRSAACGDREASRPGQLVRPLGSLALFGLLHSLSLYAVFDSIVRDRVTTDFSLAYYRAGEALLDGERIYPTGDLVARSGFIIDYLYPPLTAILAVPFTVLESTRPSSSSPAFSYSRSSPRLSCSTSGTGAATGSPFSGRP